MRTFLFAGCLRFFAQKDIWDHSWYLVTDFLRDTIETILHSFLHAIVQTTVLYIYTQKSTFVNSTPVSQVCFPVFANICPIPIDYNYLTIQISIFTGIHASEQLKTENISC